MTPEQRRLEVLRLAKPANVSVPDMALWLAMADQLDDWLLTGSGQPAPQAPADQPETSQSPKPGHGARRPRQQTA